MEVKYEVDRFGWWSKKSAYPSGVRCWRSIITGLEKLKPLVHFEVKKGLGFLCSQDVWCRDQLLKCQFPCLFKMACFFKDSSAKSGVLEW